jgi:hypothetical protein
MLSFVSFSQFRLFKRNPFNDLTRLNVTQACPSAKSFNPKLTTAVHTVVPPKSIFTAGKSCSYNWARRKSGQINSMIDCTINKIFALIYLFWFIIILFVDVINVGSFLVIHLKQYYGEFTNWHRFKFINWMIIWTFFITIEITFQVSWGPSGFSNLFSIGLQSFSLSHFA